MRNRYPDADLVVLGDLGPGEAKARQAAEEALARLALPAFSTGAQIDDKPPTDFNDMAVLSGLAHVRDRLRDIAFRNVDLAVEGLEPILVMAADGTLDEPKEEMMSRVKETLVNDTESGSRRPSSKRGAPKQADPPDSRVPTGTSAEAEHAVTEPFASPPATNAPATGATRPLATRPSIGEPLFALTDVPNEVRALAEHRFGTPLRMSTPRENGGPYRGEVFNTEHYLIQEVATRSVVFHPKGQMEFVSERLRWMDENARLNGSRIADRI